MAFMAVFFVFSGYPSKGEREKEYARGMRLGSVAMIVVGAGIAVVGLAQMMVS